MTTNLEVVSVNVSEQKGTAKRPVDSITIDSRGGVGDAHAGDWHRQVSLLSQESVDLLASQLGQTIRPGEFGENITLRGLPSHAVKPLDRLVFGPVELEVTQIGKKCHGAGCTIFQQVGKCVMPSEGVFARVLQGGEIHPGDRGEHHPRQLSVLVITLSDRAAFGQFTDRSGPRIQELLESFFAGTRWRASISRSLLPDDPGRLREHILQATRSGADVIFTAGGTGVGPRDITPETVAPLCDKLIPGIMEHIRATFGPTNPNAWLSRSIAGVAGKTQIYTLPGSVRAVEDYVPEILKTLEHLIYMLHGLDVH